MQLLNISIVILISLISSLVFSPAVFAQSVLFSDSFETGLDNWQPVRDDGRFWKITNQALEAYIPFRSTITELLPIDQVWPADTKNIELSMKFYPIQGVDKNISFGYKDAQNWYELHITNSFTEIVKVKNGATAWVEHTGATLPNGVVYDLILRFNNGLVTLLINGQELFSIADPHFIAEFGKIGLKASTGGVFPTRIIFDDVIVKSLDALGDFSLKVPLLIQTDPDWAETEYDTASTWLDHANVSPNFKDWACNLMAQVMLLRYHGISQLPDGSELNPLNYNQWLLDNNGYINSPYTGNISRHSPSYLSSLVSQSLGTNKLEYSYVNQNMIPRAIEAIKNGQPVILQLDGHFVIADGYTEDEQDLLIKDPAYNIEKLSEHPLQLLSLRLYTPSQTDLSYFSIHTDPSTEVVFSDSPSLIINTYEEALRPAGATSQSGPVTKIIDIAKPTDANINILVKNPQATFLEVLAIQEHGTQETLLSTNQLAVGQHQYQIEFNRAGQSSLVEVTPPVSPEPSSTPTPSPSPPPTETEESDPDAPSLFSALRAKIISLSQENQIRKKQFSQVLITLTHSAEHKKRAKQQIKVLRVLELVVMAAPRIFITHYGKWELLQFINQLIKNLN